jgi:hypothetical protein
MKTRQGFVSNSSSSSFIIAGFQINSEEFEKLPYEKRSNFTCGYFDNEDFCIVGKHILDTDDGCPAKTLIKFSDIQKMEIEIRAALEKAGLVAGDFMIASDTSY